MNLYTIQSLLSGLGHLGWIPPHLRNDEQRDAHNFAMASMLPFPLLEGPLPTGFKLDLTETWRHPQVVKALGKPYGGSRQVTGSCVNSGAQNAIMTLLCINILQNGMLEDFVVPFTLLAYGKSRQLAGMRGKGEGSLGSTIAQALKQYGILDAATAGLPPYTSDNEFCWGQDAEMNWSAGESIQQKWLDASKVNLLGATADLTSTQMMVSSIVNLCPIATASMKWCQPGTEKLVGSGDNAVVIGRRTGTGGHQTGIHGVWQHPSEGLLFLRMNNWGHDIYKPDPTTGNGIGYWSPEEEEAAALHEGGAEYIAYSGPMGFVRQTPNWRVM